jgi:hypothetical protein
MEAAMYLLVAYSFGIDTFFDSFWIFLLVTLLLTTTSNLATAFCRPVSAVLGLSRW